MGILGGIAVCQSSSNDISPSGLQEKQLFDDQRKNRSIVHLNDGVAILHDSSSQPLG